MPTGVAALPPNFCVLLWLHDNKKSALYRADKRGLFVDQKGTKRRPVMGRQVTAPFHAPRQLHRDSGNFEPPPQRRRGSKATTL